MVRTQRPGGLQLLKDAEVDSIEAKLVSKLAEKFGTEPKLEDSLAYIGVDSVGMAELTIEIEKEFHIRLTDDVFGVETVGELASYIRERQGTAA